MVAAVELVAAVAVAVGVCPVAMAVGAWPPIVPASVVVRLSVVVCVGCGRVSSGVIACVRESVLLQGGRGARETKLVFVPVLELAGSVVVLPA